VLLVGRTTSSSSSSSLLVEYDDDDVPADDTVRAICVFNQTQPVRRDTVDITDADMVTSTN
jgi:hypothetical protein